MKRKLISCALLSIISVATTSVTFSEETLVYTNPNTATTSGNVNSAPTTTPAGTPTNTNQPQVEQEVVYEKNPTSSLEEKFWNVPNGTVKTIQKKYEEKQKAINLDISPPKPVNRTINVDNSPGSPPPLLRLDRNNISTILLTDSYGTGWAIDYVVNNDDISVIFDKENPNVSSLVIQSNNNTGQGNFVVFLKDNPVPVTFSYLNNQKEVDYRLDVIVKGKNPKTNIETTVSLPNAMDNELLSTLQGVAPDKSKVLKVSNNDAQAWLLADGKVLLRTKYKILNPAPISRVNSPDGTYVYKIPYIPVVGYRFNDLTSTFQIYK